LNSPERLELSTCRGQGGARRGATALTVTPYFKVSLATQRQPTCELGRRVVRLPDVAEQPDSLVVLMIARWRHAGLALLGQ